MKSAPTQDPLLAAALLNYDWHFNTKTVKICLPTLKTRKQTKVTAGFIFKSLKLLLTELSHQWQMSTKNLETQTSLLFTRNQIIWKKFEFVTLIQQFSAEIEEVFDAFQSSNFCWPRGYWSSAWKEQRNSSCSIVSPLVYKDTAVPNVFQP